MTQDDEQKKGMTETDGAQQMDPNVWGPPLWDTLFTLCFRCPSSALPDLLTLFSLLDKTIPCQHCRRSYAMYRKQVRPTTTIVQKDVPDAAAMWLWTIHDMVNQKLGKICISFDKLKQRHNAMTTLTNDLTVVDLFCIIGFATRPVLGRYAVQFIEVTTRLCAHVPGLRIIGREKLPEVHSERLLDDLFEVHARVRTIHGMIPLSRGEFDEQYASARAV